MAATQTMTLDEFGAWIRGQGERIQALDWSPALKRVAFYLSAQARLCFDQGRSPDGTAWAALVNPSARRGGSSARPLRDTGLLMASCASGVGHAEQITDSTLTWGTNVDYAAYQQFGTHRIPARPFLGVTPEYEARIVQILMDHAEKALKGD
jgi:phage gpG-like protein